ncbi:MAG: co-chaperone GroES [Limnochordia bacterium]|jgi:chaperonin GroES|nr:co-chaperone GroES [Bacillota bacterium]HOB09065.1 co-chaperone GroES [Limnochordia bacterium]NLH30760.1 co-chaperone GroES [Bacillota bacterium]HPT92846.1 co-chaperone GroES [Limnochordia bacterium]HPZ31190.1 co-chaperone GroES [Limnochordia bacterium]
MNLKPLGDRVILKVLEAEEKTASGIFLPDNAKEKPQQGKVLAVGPGKYNDKGELIKVQVKEGDVVIFAKYAGTEVKYQGEEYLIVKESDLLAVVG